MYRYVEICVEHGKVAVAVGTAKRFEVGARDASKLAERSEIESNASIMEAVQYDDVR